MFTGHFYGHLQEAARLSFLAEASRVAPELIIVDAASRADRQPVEWQQRTLNDGSRYEFYERYVAPERLLEEIGGGRILLQGRWFVMVASP